MPVASKFVMNTALYFKEALAFPIMISCSGMALVAIYASIAIHLGYHERPEQFFNTVLAIAGAVAVPVTMIAFYREHTGYVSRRRLRCFASTDPLTGLLNRRAFQDAVSDEQLRMARSDSFAALVLFDLDHFKQLNDEHGHSAGDEVLKVISSIAHSELRGPFDRLGRWGGEEFIILLNDVTTAQAEIVAERLRARIADHETESETSSIRVTASFGIAQVTAQCSFERVLSNADAALYDAKESGRNSISLHTQIKLVA